MRKKVILITGYDRCGKDYVAEKLKKVFDGDIFHLADGLKDICSDILGIDRDILDSFKNKRGIIEIETSAPMYFNKIYPITYEIRNFIIKVGETLKDRIGKNIFARMVIDKIHNSNKNVIIIPDVRYMVEELEITKEVKKMRGDIITVKIDSELTDCGKNEKFYEIPDLAIDLVFKNVEDKEAFDNSFKCFVDKLSSRLLIDNPLKDTENESRI